MPRRSAANREGISHCLESGQPVYCEFTCRLPESTPTVAVYYYYSARVISATPQSGNRVLTSLGNSGLYWTIFAWNRDTAVPAEGNGDLQTLICVLVARPRWCLTLSNYAPWQNWMTDYLGYSALQMKTLYCGWPVVGHDMHTRRRKLSPKADTYFKVEGWVDLGGLLHTRFPRRWLLMSVLTRLDVEQLCWSRAVWACYTTIPNHVVLWEHQ